jgi:hypothetical protein
VATDPFLDGVLAEAGIAGEVRSALLSEFPTVDALLAAPLADIVRISPSASMDLYRALEARWRADAAVSNLNRALPPSAITKLMERALDDNGQTTLGTVLRIRAGVDTTLRSFGINPDVLDATPAD